VHLRPRHHQVAEDDGFALTWTLFVCLLAMSTLVEVPAVRLTRTPLSMSRPPTTLMLTGPLALIDRIAFASVSRLVVN
jgi:hypothetical protein